jgi:L-malate glycosyltransferase
LSLGVQPSVAESKPAAATPLRRSSGPVSVCHIASGDLWAGAEVQVATLGRALAARSDVVVSAIILNEGKLVKELRDAGIEVLVAPESRMGTLDIFRKSCEFLRGRRIDVLHSHRYKEHLLAAMLARKLSIPSAVRTEHGLPEPFRGWKSLKLGWILALDRLVARRSTDSVIAVTEDIRNHLSHHFAPEKIRVVNNAIDLERVTSNLSSGDAKRKLGISPETVVIGTVARLEPIKRMDLFVQTCQRIHAAQPNAVFVVAGDGSDRGMTEALIRELNLSVSFHMLGERSDIADVLRAMDLFVMCSDHEGLPTALLEAMYLGVPVVARAVGGIPEVIGDSGAAELVHSDDPSAIAAGCLKALATDSPARRERGRNRVAERFSAGIMADRMVQVYRSLGGAQ